MRYKIKNELCTSIQCLFVKLGLEMPKIDRNIAQDGIKQFVKEIKLNFASASKI